MNELQYFELGVAVGALIIFLVAIVLLRRTDMDYENKYNEMLEWAKKYKALLNGVPVEEIFPELAESEDERIVKKLIWQVNMNIEDETSDLKKSVYDGIKGHDPDLEDSIEDWKKCLAWLEKQKEQKPILEVFGFKVGDAVRLKNGDGRKHIIKSFEEVEGLHGPNFYHVEFEDNSARDGIYPGGEYPNGYYTQMEKFEEEQKPWKVGANAYFTPKQKPVEWSEDFENNIRTLLHDKLTWHSEDGSMSSAVFIDDKTIKDIVSGIWFYVGKEALKYPNKELKVVEWSEEDEKKLGKCIDAVSGYYSPEDKQELKNWLKSLRPSWKPSEEQMWALRAIINEPNNAGAESCQLIIRDLYEQLKKLKEDGK